MSSSDPDRPSGDSANDGARSANHDALEPRRGARRRWPLAIGLGLLGGGAAAALVGWLVPVRYEAFALLKVARKPPAVLSKTPDSNDEFAIFKRTQVELIRSSVVMHGTLRAKEISRLSMVQEHSDDQVAWLSDQLIIDYPNDSEVLRIAMKGTRPAELAKIVNQVAATYLKEVVQHEKEIRNQERTQLEQTHAVRMRELKQDMEALHKLEEVQGASTSEAVQLEKKLVVDHLTDLMAERRDILRDLRRTKLQIKLGESRQEQPQDASPAEALAASNDSARTPLPILEKEKEFLESSLAETEKGIEDLAKVLQNLEKYSAEATAKREQLAQRLKLANEIDERLNLINVESLAQDRITKLDDASVPAGSGDAVRIRTGAAMVAVLSFGLIVVGVALAIGKAKSSRA